jgi:alkylation response protein AidB-like acyl-CoA dehydrogenase
VDLSLSAEQRDIVAAVREILASQPAVGAPAVLDRERFEALAKAGFLDLRTAESSLLSATLVVEEAAAAALCAPVAARALVAAAVTEVALPPLLGLAAHPADALVRFGGDADAFLVLDGPRALIVPRDQATVVPQRVRWGYPAAKVSVRGGTDLGPGSGAALLRAWRTAIAAEGGGLMRAAVSQAARYVTQREQFGRPIGTYQSVQHRLARGWVLAEGATWLARRAAWFASDDAAAAAAACYACEGMREVFRSVHQVVGAIGVTDEFGLTQLTGQLAYLHTELGGAAAHARGLAAIRWRGGGAGRPDGASPAGTKPVRT